MLKKMFTTVPALMIVMLFIAGIASAHVKVYPEKVTKGAYETFTVSMPSEKENANTEKLKVVIPKGVDISRVEPRAGWTYQLKKNNTGKITAIVWSTDGKGLTPNEFIELKMEGKIGDNAASLRFKAYQTYSDGSVVKWVEAEGAEHPAPIVKVSAASMDQNQTDGPATSDLPLYLSIAAIILGIIAIILAAMKRKA